MIDGVERAEFELINNENVGLAGFFSVNPLSCENPSFYKNYLQFSALYDLNTGHTVTHLIIDKSVNRIMGFVSLRASSIISYDENKTMLGKPAVEIYMLAVDKDYERRKVGRSLIDHAISTAYELHNNHIGIKCITLAADTKAVGFYEAMEFSHLDEVWEKMPKESWSVNCEPMIFEFNFDADLFESFIDAEDDD